MTTSKPLVLHTTEQDLDELDDPVTGSVAFRTLFSGDVTPTNEITTGDRNR